MNYRVEEIFAGYKKDYMDLLLLADEQEDVIDKYLAWAQAGSRQAVDR
jgi:hypothetical protein